MPKIITCELKDQIEGQTDLAKDQPAATFFLLNNKFV